MTSDEVPSVDARAGSWPIGLSNDEIEVACDLLWFIKNDGELSRVAEGLWQRLQPLRHGDYGGTGDVQLSADEAREVIRVAELDRRQVRLDADETALVSRLRSLLE